MTIVTSIKETFIKSAHIKTILSIQTPDKQAKIQDLFGINIAPLPLKNFSHQNSNSFLHQSLFFLQNFSKMNKCTPMFIPESRESDYYLGS